MRIWRYLRAITFSLIVVSPILLQTGCGGGGGGDTSADIPPEDDPTLNLDSDSTMNPKADSKVKEGEKEGKAEKE